MKRSSRRPRSNRREAQQLQVIHRAYRGWASVNNVWTCGPGSCRSAPLASESGAGLPRSLVAARRRRGVTEPLGREGNRRIEDRPKLEFSPSASTPSSPGCSAVRTWCKSFSLPTARRHTRPADWAESKIWADWPGTEALLKGPFFTSSALALPPLPHPLPLHISAQATILVLCSSVFLCVVGVLCFAGVSLAFRYASPLS